jgi:hypothetical protein
VTKRSSERRRPRFRKSSERRIPAALAEVRGRWLEPTRAAVPYNSRRSARAQRRAPGPAGFDRWALSGGRAPSAARRWPIRTRPLWAFLGTERGTDWAPRRPRCQAEVPEFVSSSAQRAKCPTPKDIGGTPPPLETLLERLICRVPASADLNSPVDSLRFRLDLPTSCGA